MTTKGIVRSMACIIVLGLSGLLLSCAFLTDIFTGIPATPTGVTATGAIANITVSWSPVYGATSYAVYYTDDGTTPTKSSYTDYFDSISGTTYAFIPDSFSSATQVCVTASSSNGESSASSAVMCSTLVPTNLAVTPGSTAGTFSLGWTAVDGASSYWVYDTHSTSATSFTAPTESSNSYECTNPHCGWTGCKSGDYYHFVVAAVDANGNEGALCAVVTAQAP